MSFHKHKIYWLISLTLVVIIILLVIKLIWLDDNRSGSLSPIPSSISKAVNFPLYIPNAKKLPTGYALDTKSIYGSTQAVVLKVLYGGNNHQDLIMTEQAQPSANQLQNFYAKNIPLHNNLSTTIGTALIGALNNQTFVSLTTSKTWLIITAPTNINQSHLKEVLLSLVKT